MWKLNKQVIIKLKSLKWIKRHLERVYCCQVTDWEFASLLQTSLFLLMIVKWKANGCQYRYKFFIDIYFFWDKYSSSDSDQYHYLLRHAGGLDVHYNCSVITIPRNILKAYTIIAIDVCTVKHYNLCIFSVRFLSLWCLICQA